MHLYQNETDESAKRLHMRSSCYGPEQMADEATKAGRPIGREGGDSDSSGEEESDSGREEIDDDDMDEDEDDDFDGDDSAGGNGGGSAGGHSMHFPPAQPLLC